MKYFLTFLAVFVSAAAFAQPVYMVDDQKACPELLRRFNIHPDQVQTYPGDLEQCESARKACYGIRDIIATHCVEKMGHEYANELDYQSNVNTARIRATPTEQGGWGEGIQAVGSHMKGFCPGYLAKKASQVDFCAKADDLCDDGGWKLSTGHEIVCKLFSVKREDFIKLEKGAVGLCDFARDMNHRISAETADRRSTCAQYGAVQDASVGNTANPAATQNYLPGENETAMDAGEEGYAPAAATAAADDLPDMKPSPCQNSLYDNLPECSTAAAMPQKSLVDKFFDLFR
jgi:hypothetical protein